MLLASHADLNTHMCGNDYLGSAVSSFATSAKSWYPLSTLSTPCPINQALSEHLLLFQMVQVAVGAPPCCPDRLHSRHRREHQHCTCTDSQQHQARGLRNHSDVQMRAAAHDPRCCTKGVSAEQAARPGAAVPLARGQQHVVHSQAGCQLHVLRGQRRHGDALLQLQGTRKPNFEHGSTNKSAASAWPWSSKPLDGAGMQPSSVVSARQSGRAPPTWLHVFWKDWPHTAASGMHWQQSQPPADCMQHEGTTNNTIAGLHGLLQQAHLWQLNPQLAFQEFQGPEELRN